MHLPDKNMCRQAHSRNKQLHTPLRAPLYTYTRTYTSHIHTFCISGTHAALMFDICLRDLSTSPPRMQQVLLVGSGWGNSFALFFVLNAKGLSTWITERKHVTGGGADELGSCVTWPLFLVPVTDELIKTHWELTNACLTLSNCAPDWPRFSRLCGFSCEQLYLQ